MRLKVFFLLLMAFVCIQIQAQDRNGKIILAMSTIPSVDTKCDVYTEKPSESFIQNLMDNGRYVKSVVRTKFGYIVIHERNVNNIKQLYSKAGNYYNKNHTKKLFKQGYSLKWCDGEGMGIYEINPKITVQKFVSLGYSPDKRNANLKKWNSQGLYFILTELCKGIVQNGHGNNIEQHCEFLMDKTVNLDPINRKGYVLSSSINYYDWKRNYNSYDVIFDKLDNNGWGVCWMLDTPEKMKTFISEHMSKGLNVTSAFCSYNGKEYDPDALSKESDSSVWDLLGGIIQSASSLANQKNANSYSTTYSNGSSSYSSSSNTESTYKDSSSSSTSVCKQCGGSGKCTGGTGSSAKYHCHGTGKCGWCQGDGFTYTAGNPITCSRCHGKGKCTYCNGSGRCSSCNGTGRA